MDQSAIEYRQLRDEHVKIANELKLMDEESPEYQEKKETFNNIHGLLLNIEKSVGRCYGGCMYGGYYPDGKYPLPNQPYKTGLWQVIKRIFNIKTKQNGTN